MGNVFLKKVLGGINMSKKDVYSYHLTLVRKKNGKYDKRKEFGLGEFFSEVDKSSMRYCSVGLNGLNRVFRLPSFWRLLSSKVRNGVEREVERSLSEEFDTGFLQGRVGLVSDVFSFKDSLLKKKVGRKKK